MKVNFEVLARATQSWQFLQVGNFHTLQKITDLFSGAAGENTCLLFYYENLIKSSHLAVSQKFWSKDLPVKMDIIAFFPIPKQLKKLLPTCSPDLDNVAKSVCDALNGVAYFDDSQICKLSIHKYYAKVPKIIVILGDWGDNLN